jgi:hypothetical protein
MPGVLFWEHGRYRECGEEPSQCSHFSPRKRDVGRVEVGGQLAGEGLVEDGLLEFGEGSLPSLVDP